MKSKRIHAVNAHPWWTTRCFPLFSERWRNKRKCLTVSSHRSYRTHRGESQLRTGTCISHQQILSQHDVVLWKLFSNILFSSLRIFPSHRDDLLVLRQDKETVQTRETAEWRIQLAISSALEKKDFNKLSTITPERQNVSVEISLEEERKKGKDAYFLVEIDSSF